MMNTVTKPSDAPAAVAQAMEHNVKTLLADQYCQKLDVVHHGGSRGSGKTTGMLLTIVRVITQQGHRSRVFLGRESHAGCIQIGNELFLMLCMAFGKQNVTRNQNAGTISIQFPDGIASVEIRPFSDTKQYASIQGKTYTAAFFDEAGNYSKAGWDMMWTIQSNMRGPEGWHLPVLILSNPFGSSHGRIVQTFLKHGILKPWSDESGLRYINVHSTLRDNDHIDQTAYIARLKRACKGNPDKEAAWIKGEYNLNLSSFFGGQYDPNIHLLPESLTVQELLRYGPVLRGGGDWGTRSACCFHLGLKLNRDIILEEGGRTYRAGSLFIMAETHTLADPENDLSLGTGIAPEGWAELIKDLCLNQCGLRAVPPTRHDTARGLNNDLVHQLLSQSGVPCYPPTKNRAQGWALITQMLDAAKHDTGPGLYIHPRCTYLLATLPDAPANPHNPDDIDPKFADDHALDSASYLVTFAGTKQGSMGKIKSPY